MLPGPMAAGLRKGARLAVLRHPATCSPTGALWAPARCAPLPSARWPLLRGTRFADRSSRPASVQAGEAPPTGRAALGWRVGVWWPAESQFFMGEVVGHDAAAGGHEVAYDDGEEAPIDLAADVIKWILPPGVSGAWP